MRDVTSSRVELPHAPPGMLWIPGGRFRMGSADFYPEERPVHEVTVDGFWMDAYEVTNEQFARFADETGYVTVAERAPKPEDFPGAPPENLVPGSMVFRKRTGPVDLRNYANWWTWMPGASWRHPQGPRSSLDDLRQHPVVHVAYEDVEAYSRWAGKDLATEAEWEFAARGGLDGAAFTWGDEESPGGKAMVNSWQGEFPWQNLLDRRPRRHLSCRLVSTKRVRPVRHGRQCVGVDERLVRAPRRESHRQVVLHGLRQPARCLTGRRASIPTSRSFASHAAWSRAARICARRTTASAIVPPPGSRR